MSNVKQFTDKLEKLNYENMYNGDFFLTWEKTDDEIQAVYEVADALRHLRENNVSTKIFDSGLGISLFRDNSTRTRFSFASACSMMSGLTPMPCSSFTECCVGFDLCSSEPLKKGTKVT